MNETRTIDDAPTINCFEAIFPFPDPLASMLHCTGLIHDIPLPLLHS
jgi:hypothetical protein